MRLFTSNPLLYVILGFCLTFSTWLEPSKLSAQCFDCEDDTIWFYPYDPCEFYFTVPWSSTCSRNIVVVFLAVGLGCIAGMIAGNVASKNNSGKHHHHHHHHKDRHCSGKHPGFQVSF